VKRRLGKEESRARWRELRILWNEFDPIGVVDAAEVEICREYESYVGDVLRLLEKETPAQTIVAYLHQLVTGHIGLPWSSGLAARTETFVARCRDWYGAKWPDTYV
jgi:hypothetical protein